MFLLFVSPFLDELPIQKLDVSGCGQDWQQTSSQFTKRCGQHRPVVIPLFDPLYIYIYYYYYYIYIYIIIYIIILILYIYIYHLTLGCLSFKIQI